MPITCNIDQHGKKARIFLGAFIESIGLLLGVLWFLEFAPAWVGVLAAVVWLGGIFVIVEGVVGWCVLRALGVQTPL